MTTNLRPGPEISSLYAFGSAIYSFDKTCHFVPKSGTKHFVPVSCKRLQTFHTDLNSYRSEFFPVSCKYPLRKTKRIAKFDGLEPRSCEDINGNIVAPEIRPKSFGTFEKQASSDFFFLSDGGGGKKFSYPNNFFSHRQKSRTFCSRIHWSAEYVILQWDKNKMAARTSKTDQGRDKFHTKY